LGDVKGLERPIVANFWPLPLLKLAAVMLPLLGDDSLVFPLTLLALLLLIMLMLLLMKGLLALKVVVALLPPLKIGVDVSRAAAENTSEKSVSRWTPAKPFKEKCVTLTGRPGAGTAVRGGGRWGGGSRLTGSGSRSTRRWGVGLLLEEVPRLRVSLSPP
jgi:hypothetical protein